MAEGCCRAAVESEGFAHDDGCLYLAGLIEGRKAGRGEGYADALLEHGLLGDAGPFEMRDHAEWATFHHGHHGGGPDPMVNDAGREEWLADIRVQAWKKIPHERTVKMRRTVRTIYGPWEEVEQSD